MHQSPGVPAMRLPMKILFMLTMLACSTKTAMQDPPYFELVEATAQEWIAGVPGGGRGIHYSLQIHPTTEQALEFDSLWVAGRKLSVNARQEPPENDAAAKHSTIILIASDNKSAPPNISPTKTEEKLENTPAPAVTAPVAYQGEALLSFRVNGLTKYYAIPKIKVLSTRYGQ